MRRLKLLIILFFLALAIPLGYVLLRAYQSLEQEEMAELQYFAATLFNAMEEELEALILREEQRAVDEYSSFLTSPDANEVDRPRSPLATVPAEPYILGYLQNNPDGSFQTPLTDLDQPVVADRRNVTDRLQDANTLLNTLKITTLSEQPETSKLEMVIQSKRQDVSNLAEKYLDESRLRKPKVSLGQAEEQKQEISRDQAVNVAQMRSVAADKKDVPANEAALPKNLQVEISPMQSVVLNDREILIFRRIVLENQVYRQGFVLLVNEFLNHLQDTYFTAQPLAQFTQLQLEVLDQGRSAALVQAGAASQKPVLSLRRVFPRPFAFLQATLTCDRLPQSTSRGTLTLMIGLMTAIILAGMLTIYQSARTVVELSERRGMFVSSVTHELKTPLTTIRMYIEMLEQGIAPNREREQEYFRVLGSESSRLSRLITNVLEFSKLEKKQRRFNLQEGDFDDVIREVQDILGVKLQQAGFTFNVERDELRPFKYDREVMVQVLINLLENSLKFGKNAPEKAITLRVRTEGDHVAISVSDTGPGIPRAALKKIFDDFYRVDNEFTRATQGTGIGLALVKRFVAALGGTVKATNNKGSGCTMTIALPR